MTANKTSNRLDQIGDQFCKQLFTALDQRIDRLEALEERLTELVLALTVASASSQSRAPGMSGGGGRCKDCNTPIIFMVTKLGKAIPCNPGHGVSKNGDYDPKKHTCHQDTCSSKKAKPR